MDFEVSVEVTQLPQIKVQGYDELKEQVSELVEEMKKVEVTEENIKGAKKMIAEVRKKWAVIDKDCKQVKQELLKPYAELDSQKKELEKLINEGDSAVREQVRELEIAERNERKEQLAQMFEELRDYYNLPDDVIFESVLNKQLLNKSVSFKKAEEGLNQTAKRLYEDLEFIKTMIDDESEQVEVMSEWLDNGYNAQLAVKKHKEHKKRIDNLKQYAEQEDEPQIILQPTELTKRPVGETHTLVIYGDSINSVISFCMENGIKFTQTS